MSSFNFPYYIGRDNESILVDIEATVSPADPDTGIMSNYVEKMKVTDANKMPVQVTDVEYEAILDEANDRLPDLNHCDLDDLFHN